MIIPEFEVLFLGWVWMILILSGTLLLSAAIAGVPKEVENAKNLIRNIGLIFVASTVTLMLF